MKWMFTPISGLLLAAGLTIVSCKKDVHLPGSCPKRTDCRVTAVHNSHNNGEYYSVSFNSNGLPASLHFKYMIVPFEMDVVYAGRNLSLVKKGTQDTVLTAQLDDCGRPLSAWSKPFSWDVERTFKFEYDIRGRLAKHVRQSESFTNVQTYGYDYRGNIVAITSESATAQRQLFTYDYSRPIEGRHVIVGDPVGWTDFALEVLKALDHIDLKPRNLPKKYENWAGDYQLADLAFNDFELDSEGRVVKYYSGDPASPYTRYTAISWGQCGGKPAK
ncbi:hypothetical protein ACWKWU_18690 [Chitinophaga lutea]